ncbi:hypothetical protein RSOL_375540 [Rhizoctonia solani AG-3 Rhs1AP]|uniref:F-box domain-containing protein n=1 Tax=Rhizoctonia solani AG-3 Rhs1AP TaxID=1086054 RepID=X8JB78_9AGAM|nr:hypothetical protein RSOL_375540 [Rhizoctonia solani AG-3 Rhs1AP]
MGAATFWSLRFFLLDSTENDGHNGSGRCSWSSVNVGGVLTLPKECDESEQEEVEPPPRKRQRATNNAPKVLPGKKQIPDKRSFATLADMPLDIFIEIATYLLPIDVIHMARLTKSTRSMLMHRSSIHVWHASMRNIQDLPDCPPDLSEPHFLFLIFMNACSACGGSTKSILDETLRVRLCGPCRTKHIIYDADVPRELAKFLLWSSGKLVNPLIPPKRRLGEYTLLADYEAITVEYKQVMLARSKRTLREWTTEKERINNRRQKEASDLTQFMKAMEADRKKEQKAVSEARWTEVHRRLQELGWESEDMDFTKTWSTRQQEWRTLVLQPKPINNLVWAQLRPKLIPLLKINRNARWRAGSGERRRARADRLLELMDNLRLTTLSTLELKVKLRLPLSKDTYSTTAVTYQEPFPDFNQVSKWPILSKMRETDVSIADMENCFQKQQEDIKEQIAEWQSYIPEYFVELLDAQGKCSQPATGVDHPDLSNDLKRLLRADVLFCNSSCFYGPKEPLTYDDIFSSGLLIPSSGHQSSGGLPYLGNTVLYPEAQEVARLLLVDMGIPNASCLEMQAYKSKFACGRCHDARLGSWTGLVRHYVEANELYADIQKANSGITYNHVHDPLYTERPMTIYRPPKVPHSALNQRRECMLCEALPVKNRVSASKAKIIQHLVEVHDVAEPVAGEHYSRG